MCFKYVNTYLTSTQDNFLKEHLLESTRGMAQIDILVDNTRIHESPASSDHIQTYFSIHIKANNKDKQSMRRNLHKDNYTNIRKCSGDFEWNDCFMDKSISECWEIITGEIDSASRIFILFKSQKCKTRKIISLKNNLRE